MSKKTVFLDIFRKHVQGVDMSLLAGLMADPTEYKTVQARIIACAQEIGWTIVPRDKPSGGGGST